MPKIMNLLKLDILDLKILKTLDFVRKKVELRLTIDKAH